MQTVAGLKESQMPKAYEANTAFERFYGGKKDELCGLTSCLSPPEAGPHFTQVNHKN